MAADGGQERCSSCHRSMSGPTDLFSHYLHARALAATGGCSVCHTDPDAPKNRDTTKQCKDCHDRSATKGSVGHARVMQPPGSAIGMGKGMAPSYVDAMHGMCRKCHMSVRPDLASCSFCHKSGKHAPQLAFTKESTN